MEQEGDEVKSRSSCIGASTSARKLCFCKILWLFGESSKVDIMYDIVRFAGINLYIASAFPPSTEYS